MSERSEDLKIFIEGFLNQVDVNRLTNRQKLLALIAEMIVMIEPDQRRALLTALPQVFKDYQRAPQLMRTLMYIFLKSVALGVDLAAKEGDSTIVLEDPALKAQDLELWLKGLRNRDNQH
ncbi:hypothetical protein IH979_01960 [Patescibacteria group bacterium]|nr:hypothetical protein [Patescibacteria group bacterium]